MSPTAGALAMIANDNIVSAVFLDTYCGA